MIASAEVPPHTLAMNGIPLDSRAKSKMDGLDGHKPGQFKRHKVLPHPRADKVDGNRGSISVPRSRVGKLDLEAIDRTLSRASVSQRSTSQPSMSSVSLRRTPRRMAPGPDPPPTPPAHSRTSSSSHSALPSSPTYVATPLQSVESVRAPAPAPVTPTNQQSPPTPNLTPEQSPPAPALATRRPKPRPAINDRNPSKMTTVTDSRTESFRTAKENLESSEEEDGKSTVRPVLPSTRSSYSTVRQVNSALGKPMRMTVGLGLGLESSPENSLTPKSKGEVSKFDGDSGSGDEVEDQWDDNLMRTVKVKKQRDSVPLNGNANGSEVVEDVTVPPSVATKVLRSSSLALQESPVVYPKRRVLSDRIRPTGGAAPSASQSSINMDVRRASGISTASNVSTVVEAILVATPPQRRKTLRHVRKQSGLRDSAADLSLTPASSVAGSVPATESHRQSLTNGIRKDTRHESVGSNGTYNSNSSRKARREIEKNGGIPVVVIPDRRSSNQSSKEPSLRSASSRRTKRSQSVGSRPMSRDSRSAERTPIFERPGRRSRTLSESDGSRRGNQRTMDFPPVIPRRSSSRSAPTSHSASRTASLTADSLRAHNALQAERARKALESLPTEGFKDPRSDQKPTSTSAKALEQSPRQLHGSKTPDQAQSAKSGGERRLSEKEGHSHSPRVDRHGDPFFGERLSVQRTPFSLASIDTTGTFPEVSEAMAVNIYPHQNKSVLMVEHSNRPSENSSLKQKRYSLQDNPVIKATAPDSDTPVTPAQPTFTMDEVDSPLRNPRAPPEPPLDLQLPAIQFIPATPSGLTPMRDKERQMGNYFGEVVEKPMQRPMSLLRRALTRRRFSEHGPSTAWSPGALSRPGLLARTFSLSSRHTRRPEPGYFDHPPRESLYPDPDDRPREEHKLHPFWRPMYPEAYPDHYGSQSGEDSDDDDYWEGESRDSMETYRYPPVDNRPHPPRRSLSSRMRRTLAILPSPKDRYPTAYEDQEGTAHRTIRRTPSGNLRVVQHRRSLDSLRHYYSSTGSPRPFSPPGIRPGLWRAYSLSRTIGSKIEKIHNLPRRLSERRREKRSQELRLMISGPREVRDGVGEVIRRNSYRERW